MNIELIEFTEDFLPEVEGKYLVRTVSTGPLKIVNYLNARLTKNFNNKKQKEVCSIDVQNQTITHISKFPVQ